MLAQFLDNESNMKQKVDEKTSMEDGLKNDKNTSVENKKK